MCHNSDGTTSKEYCLFILQYIELCSKFWNTTENCISDWKQDPSKFIQDYNLFNQDV